MKKAISVLLICCIIFLAAGCGTKQATQNTTGKSKNAETTAVAEGSKSSSSGTTEKIIAESLNTTAAFPWPGAAIGQVTKGKAIYGKRTGTTKTYTGLEPLSAVQFPVSDPNNTKKLSTKAVGHSYGVAKNGKANQISVDNQKIYSKYGGLCLDTSGQKVIYLTFDCGYENGQTEKILDVLKAKKVKAAFFVTLPYIKSSPKIVARMINEGQTVGNHSTTHPNFANISRTRMAKEIQDVDNELRLHFGYSAPFFRFPEGAYSISALNLVQSIGYESVFWSSAYEDWDTSNQKGAAYAFNTVTSRLHPGCVLLLHAVSKDNAAALGKIIDWAQKNGYAFKTL